MILLKCGGFPNKLLVLQDRITFIFKPINKL